MSDDLVEQQHRREARHLGEQSGMGQHEADQQRLLLAGRGVGGRDVLGGIDDREVGQVRSVERAASGGVAGAVVA